MLMTILSITLALVSGSAIGWFAHRVYVRLDTWGRAMDQQDEIFRLASKEDELDEEVHRPHILRFDGRAPDTVHAEGASTKRALRTSH